ncbi:MAG: hypothetical protein JO261_01410 [Alphaproteobacteria bacterium]|nr:hypothetical protein [Alphaproteobacteria bacterium]MBV9692334.1 hypothetical protein [Alphaproteobacteria bacterium]
MQDIGASAALYPFAYDRAQDRLMLVPMDADAYREASFLDARLGRTGRWFSAASIEAALADGHEVRPLHFIFHAGHVGSTLLSRLLDQAEGVLSLREPMPLRELAEAHDSGDPAFASRLELLMKLWERGFPETRTVIVKATSATQRIGAALLRARPAAKAVALNVCAETYLATMLAGENSAGDLNALGPERWGRLQRLLGKPVPAPNNLGELIAMSWAAESLTQQDLIGEFGARVLAIDFDEMLETPAEFIAAVLDHFQIEGDAHAIAESSVTRSYSKAPEHAYSSELRARLLEQARTAYAPEISQALSWLNTLSLPENARPLRQIATN